MSGNPMHAMDPSAFRPCPDLPHSPTIPVHSTLIGGGFSLDFIVAALAHLDTDMVLSGAPHPTTLAWVEDKPMAGLERALTPEAERA